MTGVGALLMSMVLLWSGALAAGFAWAAASGKMSFGRTLMFWLIAGFLSLLAARTGYEMVRRLVRSRRFRNTSSGR
jgi:hypothetical protein